MEHYQEQKDGTFILIETDTLLGTTGELVTAIPKTYEGYMYDSTIAGTITSGEVNGDNSLVLKLYYKKNKVMTTITIPSTSLTTKNGLTIQTNDITNDARIYILLIGLSLFGIIYDKKRVIK